MQKKAPSRLCANVQRWQDSGFKPDELRPVYWGGKKNVVFSRAKSGNAGLQSSEALFELRPAARSEDALLRVRTRREESRGREDCTLV